MDRNRLIVFLSIILSVWALLSIYVYRRSSAGLPEGWLRTAFSWGFLLLTVAYPLSRFLERGAHNPIANAGLDALLYLGSLWMAAIVYLLLAILAWDIARLIGHLPPLSGWADSAAWVRAWLRDHALSFVLAIPALGARVERHVHRRRRRSR